MADRRRAQGGGRQASSISSKVILVFVAAIAVTIVFAVVFLNCCHRSLPREDFVGTWVLYSSSDGSTTYDEAYMQEHSIDPAQVASMVLNGADDGATFSINGASIADEDKKITWSTSETALVLNTDGGAIELEYDADSKLLTMTLDDGKQMRLKRTSVM